MKGLYVNVFRHGSYDCTNGGITSKVDSILLLDSNLEGGLYEYLPDKIYLKLIRRNLFGHDYIHAVPAMNGVRLDLEELTTFGGNFIYSSDSRFRKLSAYPIPVHDRFE